MKKYYILYMLLMSIALLITPDSNAALKKFSSGQVQQIQQIMHDYLINNPEVLVEVSNALQQKQLTAVTNRIETSIPKYADQIFQANNRPAAGNPKGNITMVEFFDYQCPHCKAMLPIIHALIKANLNLKIIFVEWPIFGVNSRYAAEAALASLKQGKYHDFHNALLNKGYSLDKQAVLKIAKSVGINTWKLKRDMRDKAIDQQLQANFALAKATGIIQVGTPVFIIGNVDKHQFRFVPGQVDQATLQKAIDQVKDDKDH
jgi:protein-disulfide isomerase